MMCSVNPLSAKLELIKFRIGLLLILLALSQTHHAWAQDNYPLPERFLRQDDVAGYVQAAQKYLKAHANSEFAPRVALDLLMLSRLHEKTAIAEDMETKLLLDYLETMQGQYVASTFYAKAEDYRSRLTKLLDRHLENPINGFAPKYRRALGAGSKKFGKELFDDNDFLLKSALAVASGDAELERTLLGYFKERAQEDDNLRAIAALAMDETKPLPERIVGLHEKSEDTEEAGLLRDLLLVRVDKSTKDTPALRQVAAELLLNQKKFQAALPIFEQLPLGKDGDKILFQRLWCHAVAGDMKSVAELQARLDKEFPVSPWRERGLQLSHAAENAEKNLGLYADAIRGVVDKIKNDSDEIESSLSYEKEGAGKKYTAYLAFSSKLNLFEIQIREGENLVIAYKATAADSMLFMNDEPIVRRYLQFGLVVSPQFDMTRNQDNTLELKAGVEFHQFGGNGPLPPFFNSPYLNELESIKAMIKTLARKGMLLGDVAESPAGRTFSLLQPQVLKPAFSELRIVVSNDNRIVSMQNEKLNLHNVQYGPANSVKFAPPPWPTLKTVTEEKFDNTMFFKTFFKVMEIYSSPK